MSTEKKNEKWKFFPAVEISAMRNVCTVRKRKTKSRIKSFNTEGTESTEDAEKDRRSPSF